jgi:hypothetical protein
VLAAIIRKAFALLSFKKKVYVNYRALLALKRKLTKNNFLFDALKNFQGWFMVLNATFNNISVISCWSVLLVEKTGGCRENHRPVASH